MNTKPPSFLPDLKIVVVRPEKFSNLDNTVSPVLARTMHGWFEIQSFKGEIPQICFREPEQDELPEHVQVAAKLCFDGDMQRPPQADQVSSAHRAATVLREYYGNLECQGYVITIPPPAVSAAA